MLILLVGCGASSPPPVCTSPRMQVATGVAPATIADAAGVWSGPEWGAVFLNSDGTGTYTDTYGTGPGRIEIRVVDGVYAGRWWESERRFGTLRFIVAPDGRTIRGAWEPDPECTLGVMRGGMIRWTREGTRRLKGRG